MQTLHPKLYRIVMALEEVGALPQKLDLPKNHVTFGKKYFQVRINEGIPNSRYYIMLRDSFTATTPHGVLLYQNEADAMTVQNKLNHLLDEIDELAKSKVEKIMFHGQEINAPLRQAPKVGNPYWALFCITAGQDVPEWTTAEWRWDDDFQDLQYLEEGRAFRTKQDAHDAADVLNGRCGLDQLKPKPAIKKMTIDEWFVATLGAVNLPDPFPRGFPRYPRF